EAAGAEARRDLARRPFPMRERERRHAALHRRESVQRERVGQTVEEALAERALVPADRVPADGVDVLDGRDEAGEQLVGERSGLEAAAERLVGGGPHLVWAPRGEQLGAGEGDAEMRAEELVRRADEHVNAQRLDVDRSVR